MISSPSVNASHQIPPPGNLFDQDFVFECILRNALFPGKPVNVGNVLSLEKYLGTRWAECRLGLVKVRAYYPRPQELPELCRTLDKLETLSSKEASWRARATYLLSMLFAGALHSINYGPFARAIPATDKVPEKPRSLFSRCFQNRKGELVLPRNVSKILAVAGVIPQPPASRDPEPDYMEYGLRLKNILESYPHPSLQSVFDYYEAMLERPVPFEVLALASFIRNRPAFSTRTDSEKRTVLAPADERSADLLKNFALDFDSVYFEHLRRFIPLYISSSDLESMGLADAEIQEIILSRIAQGRVLGFIQDRETALAGACLYVHEFGFRIRYSSEMLLEPADELSRFLNSSELPPITNKEKQYTIRRFELRGRRQLDDDADLPVNTVSQGNYPRLLSICGGNEDLMFKLFEMLSEGPVSSVPELEAALESIAARNKSYGSVSIAPDQLGIIEKTPALWAVVEREWDEAIPQIDVPFGIQAKNHAGYGISHILFQRKLDGTFGKEDSPFGSQEEFLDVLLHSLGAARFDRVSERLPETHLILRGEDTSGNRRSFVFVVASKSGRLELITAYLQQDIDAT